MTVLVLAERQDLHADCIVARAHGSGEKVVRLSPVCEFGLEFNFSSDRCNVFTLGGRKIDINHVSGVYCRIALERISECFEARDAVERFSIEEEASAWLSALLLIPRELWINDPRSELWADVKPHSLLVAARLGISVPSFIITNSLNSAALFAAGRQAVVKPISDASFSRQFGEYVTIPDFDSFEAPGTRIFEWEKLVPAQVDSTPFLLQNRIVRDKEFRVTVVDAEVFVAKTEIPINRIDIKDEYPPESQVGHLPEDTKEKLIFLTKNLGLRFCTFDLLEAVNGEIWLVDINPGGNWLSLDSLFEGGISLSILHSLCAINR